MEYDVSFVGNAYDVHYARFFGCKPATRTISRVHRDPKMMWTLRQPNEYAVQFHTVFHCTVAANGPAVEMMSQPRDYSSLFFFGGTVQTVPEALRDIAVTGGKWNASWVDHWQRTISTFKRTDRVIRVDVPIGPHWYPFDADHVVLDPPTEIVP